MRRSILFGLITALGVAICITGLIFQITLNIDLIEKEKITITYDQNCKLACNYYPNGESNLDLGVMIFHGYAEDKNTMKSYTYAFLQAGFQVFSVDLAGHGRSTGSFAFNNATDEIQGNHVLLAKEEFKLHSGLNDSQIILLGHSFGARAILRAATLDVEQVRGLIIVGGLINLEGGYFPENDWLQELNPNNPSTNISIITGSLEDVLTPSEAIVVYELLANQTYSEANDYVTTSSGNLIKLTIVDGLFHTYQTISPSCIANSIENAFVFNGMEIDDTTIAQVDTKQSIRISTWVFIPTGLFIVVIFGILWLDLTTWGFPTKREVLVYPPEGEEEDEETARKLIRLTNLKEFLWYKIVIWIGAITIGCILAAIFLALPIGVPIFTLVYACPLAGYGILMLILFGFGKMPGLEGKWHPRLTLMKSLLNWKRTILAVTICVIINSIFAYFINITWNNVFPTNFRILWLFLLTTISTLGFYVKRQESNVLRKARPGNYGLIVFNNVVFLTPFILVVVILAIGGMYILFVDALHGFLIFTLVVFTGGLIQRFCKNSFFTAVLQSFMLILLALPRTPLMTVFY